MIRCLLIDDETLALDLMEDNLKQVNYIQVAGRSRSSAEALQILQSEQIDLIFCDIHMPGLNGLQLIKSLMIKPMVIFVTAYEKFALEGFELDVLDYLVKPVDKDELMEAVNKFRHNAQRDLLKQFNALLSHIKKSNDLSLQKIALPTMHGYELIPLNNIMYCESKSNYTSICLNNGQQMLISKTLKDIEDLLNMQPFFRVHNSFLVNLQYAIRYIRGEGGSLVLNNDITVPVSRNKKEELLKLITHLSA